MKILQSIEGGEFKQVDLPTEFINHLFKFNQFLSDNFNDLLTIGLSPSKLKEYRGLSSKLERLKVKYNLDKYDVRANYKMI